MAYFLLHICIYNTKIQCSEHSIILYLSIINIKTDIIIGQNNLKNIKVNMIILKIKFTIIAYF